MDELAKKRADKEGDSRKWSPTDALEDVLRAIKAGELKPSQIVIHMLEEKDVGGYLHRYCVAGVTFPQHIAMLNVALARVISDWRDV